MEQYQIQSALETFGKDFNIRQCQEECAELIVALNHFVRGRCEPKDVLSELADVRIMCQVMLELFDGENNYTNYREVERYKITRLLTRIENRLSGMCD